MTMASGRGTGLSFCESLRVASVAHNVAWKALANREWPQQQPGSSLNTAPPPLPSLADPFVNHYLLLLTWVLAVIGWFVAFIAMCVGEARYTSTLSTPLFSTLVSPARPLPSPRTPFRRGQPADRASSNRPLPDPQWFAIFLQLAIMAGFFIAIATDSLPLYQLQLAVFTAVALVFAVQGVNNIFVDDGAPQAAGAGWLILAIVDIVWLLFLTSEKPTLFNHLLNHPAISHGNQLVHPSGNRGFSGGAPGSVGGGGNGGVGGYASGKGNRSSSIAEINPSGSSQNGGGFYGGGGNGGSGLGGGISSDHLKAEQSPLVGMDRNHHPGETQSAMSTTGGSAPGGGPILKRAKALYACASPLLPPSSARARRLQGHVRPRDSAFRRLTGCPPLLLSSADQASPDDPQEVSMTKGELLDVLDNSGKWWQVAKTDGSGIVGIIPSNYAVLV